MIEFLSQLDFWHWVILALVLLGAEMIGAGGMLLGAMVASVLLAVLQYALGLSWQYQLITYAISSVIFSYGYWRFFKKFNQTSDRPELNNRAAQLIGHRLVLKQQVEFQGRVQIGDTFWKVKADQVLAADTHVEVISAEVDTLHIKAID